MRGSLRQPFLVGAGEIETRTAANGQRQRQNHSHDSKIESRGKTECSRATQIKVARDGKSHHPVTLVEDVIDIEAEGDGFVVPWASHGVTRAQINLRPGR